VDVWSIGCIVAELFLQSRPLFMGQNDDINKAQGLQVQLIGDCVNWERN